MQVKNTEKTTVQENYKVLSRLLMQLNIIP